MVDLDNIGTVEILRVSHSGRRYYLPLKKDFIDVYGLKAGDRLRVKIEGRIKEAGGEETG